MWGSKTCTRSGLRDRHSRATTSAERLEPDFVHPPFDEGSQAARRVKPCHRLVFFDRGKGVGVGALEDGEEEVPFRLYVVVEAPLVEEPGTGAAIF
jgi:hypothetical protein